MREEQRRIESDLYEALSRTSRAGSARSRRDRSAHARRSSCSRSSRWRRPDGARRATCATPCTRIAASKPESDAPAERDHARRRRLGHHVPPQSQRRGDLLRARARSGAARRIDHRSARNSGAAICAKRPRRRRAKEQGKPDAATPDALLAEVAEMRRALQDAQQARRRAASNAGLQQGAGRPGQTRKRAHSRSSAGSGRQQGRASKVAGRRAGVGRRRASLGVAASGRSSRTADSLHGIPVPIVALGELETVAVRLRAQTARSASECAISRIA